jgi:hypothetical protein
MRKQTQQMMAALVALALLLPALVWAAYPAEVPRTGQTRSYAAGDDGDIQAGVAWPDPRFIDSGGGTVTDKLTGLEWTKDANAAARIMTWQEALNYVKTLNTGGHNDWRLPNINELESLVNAGRSNPALPLNYPFSNVQSDGCWSSTSVADGTNDAWVVDMYDGGVYRGDKTDGSYGYVSHDGKSHYAGFVWPVREGQCGSLDNSVICLPKTGQTDCYNDNGTIIDCAGTGQDGDIQAGVAWPNPRFVDHGDGTVTDSLTGLEWTKDVSPVGGTWHGVLYNVKTLATGGHSDWRPPNRRELRSLADYARNNPALPQGHPFTNLVSNDSDYWSSTSYAGSSQAYADYTHWFWAWRVDFNGGNVYSTHKVNGSNLWPVRAGQVDNSTISSCPAKKVLGADNPKLENLRDFRDSKLAQSAVGRRIIGIYYNNADSINAALERSPALRAVTRRVLEVVAPMVGRKE